MQSECSLTFGASDLQTNRFFTANGTGVSPAKKIVDVGSAFVIGAPMILIGFSWDKMNIWNGAFDIARDGEFLLHIGVSGYSGGGPIDSHELFDVGSIIQCDESGIYNPKPMLKCVITLFFQPFSIELQRPITDVGLNIIPSVVKTSTRIFLC
jgi:hypothetical protein